MMPLTTADHCVALIDIGNTRMKIGWVNPATGAREPTALALEHKHINHLIAWFGEQNVRPGTAVGVNVAGGSKAQAIEKLLQDSFNASVHWLRSQPQAAGVLNRYTDTAQLGADRWIAMIGLSQIHPDATTPLLLASFGTATTLDTLCPADVITSTAAASASQADCVCCGEASRTSCQHSANTNKPLMPCSKILKCKKALMLFGQSC